MKVIFWALLIGSLIFLVHQKRDGLTFKLREMETIVRRRFGGRIDLNDSFADDIESGLHSQNFDIMSNNTNDQRSGLDEESKNAIRDIMNSENVSFDKARLIFTEQRFGENAIAPDGTPLDPKAVTFSS